ncbi:alpha-hydroxy-acid oxidizing protein [Virgibacillus sp. C22-A2]|uniref:L-lactate oxidase n=1 Tax=Virgibacillus tibetensis TaxID=3042313 RepID=A0ABU6KG63_9BACI|nr:alpha-hydroxy-acid oxidizing protein [Virgibacillus sp. C22-A2]
MDTTKSNDVFLQNISSDEYFPVPFEELEEAAKQKIDASAFGYIQSGAGGEETLRKNNTSFSKYSIVPTFLKDVSKLDTSITLFGRTYPYPLLLAPVGMLKLADEAADIAVAKAAAAHQIPFIQSTVSSYSIEEITAATGDSPKWFQLYWSNHRETAFNMVKRAEKAGYEAIVLTIDTFSLGWRETDLKNRFSPLMQGFGKANYETDDVFLASLPNQQPESVIQGIKDNINHPSLNWDDIRELKKRTTLPVLLKGILHPEDALQATRHGVDGIIISNHGGRQLDGVISSIDALPEIAAIIDGKIPVLLDSGIRRGSDVVKAIALGADAVLLGRPFVYSLAVGGETGVRNYLANFKQDVQASTTLSGAATMQDLRDLTITRT